MTDGCFLHYACTYSCLGHIKISIISISGLLPLWLYTLGQEFLTENEIKIPFIPLVFTILYLTTPLLVGMVIKVKLPKVKDTILKALTPFTIIGTICICTVGTISNFYAFHFFDPIVVLMAFMLPLLGYTISGIVAFLCKQPRAKVVAIVIETGLQNVGIAWLLLMYNVPAPGGEIAAVGPVFVILATNIIMAVCIITTTIYKKCNPEQYRTVSSLEKKNNNMDKHSDESICNLQSFVEEIEPSDDIDNERRKHKSSVCDVTGVE